eukprot:g9867.t1
MSSPSYKNTNELPIKQATMKNQKVSSKVSTNSINSHLRIDSIDDDILHDIHYQVSNIAYNEYKNCEDYYHYQNKYDKLNREKDDWNTFDSMKKYFKKYLKADITDIRFIKMWAREGFYKLYVKLSPYPPFTITPDYLMEWNQILDALDKKNMKLNIVIKK